MGNINKLPSPVTQGPLRISFLGYPIDAITAAQVMAIARESIRTRRTCTNASINASTVVAMRRDHLLATAIAKADIITADGQSIVWAARFLGLHLPERVPATDLMLQLLTLAELEGLGVYFLGSTPDVLRDLVLNASQAYRSLIICGCHHGFYHDGDEAQLVDTIRNSGADMLFLGMSSPRKELFMASHRNTLEVPLVMGVGGAFEVLAGHRKRAPAFARRHGLEWFFRMMQEPRRLWRRYLIGNAIFTWLVLAELLRPRGNGR